MKWLTHDRRVFVMALAAGLPGSLVALLLLWTGDYTSKTQWTFSILIVCLWWGFAFALRERVVFPLQTLSNLVAALREGDFSVRGRTTRSDDPLGEVMREVNALSSTLREQRLGAMEATALLRKVMAEIDVAVFTFDEQQRLRLVNRAGERLLGQPAERLLERKAGELGLAGCLDPSAPEGEASNNGAEGARTGFINFPGGAGRWNIRRSIFREGGKPHHLLVLSDLSRVLREEERQAWQRLIRVLGHELNNSLAPIKSMAGSLETMLMREPQRPDWRDDMCRGLTVIGSRAEALNRFMKGYAQLARLPRPQFQPVDAGAWVRRVAILERRLPVEVRPGPELMIRGDGDQLDQLLINLVRNAADAALETGGGVRLGWQRAGNQLEVVVEDDGPGLSSTANLFVPFFTTKPGGSGIGLVLCRQIAEAHGGSLSLDNRPDAAGCRAVLRLPL